MRFADRLQPLRSNLFDEMDAAKHAARLGGHTIVDLSIGSSDLSPPPEALTALHHSLEDPTTYGYTLFESTRTFREACAERYHRQFGLTIDPQAEVLPLIGSQEGTGCMPLALLNPGDLALLTDPCYPSHRSGVHLAQGQIYDMPLTQKRDFLPDLQAIPVEQRQQARMMILSYPHNPTAATAPLSFWQEAVQFCRQHQIILVHDFPYGDWVFEGDPAVSVFQVDREKQISIEFFSLSKSFHMGGFRVGYAIGNPELIQGLRQVRSVINFNAYQGILEAGAAALRSGDPFVQHSLSVYRRRRDLCVQRLKAMGWQVTVPRASMYLWIPLPESYAGSSMDFCVDLVKQTGVALAPGAGFGPSGEGYVRLALVAEEEILSAALDQIRAFWEHLPVAAGVAI